MKSVAKMIRLKICVGDKWKKSPIGGKQTKSKWHVVDKQKKTLEVVPNRYKQHDDKQKKTLDIVPWKRKLRFERLRSKLNVDIE